MCPDLRDIPASETGPSSPQSHSEEIAKVPALRRGRKRACRLCPSPAPHDRVPRLNACSHDSCESGRAIRLHAALPCAWPEAATPAGRYLSGTWEEEPDSSGREHNIPRPPAWSCPLRDKSINGGPPVLATVSLDPNERGAWDSGFGRLQPFATP